MKEPLGKTIDSIARDHLKWYKRLWRFITFQKPKPISIKEFTIHIEKLRRPIDEENKTE